MDFSANGIGGSYFYVINKSPLKTLLLTGINILFVKYL